MNIEIMSNDEIKKIAEELLSEYSCHISSQLSISCERFIKSADCGDYFMVVCKDNNGKPLLACGYHVDSELRTINIPFVFIKRKISPLIRGRCLIMAINTFLKITHEYSGYSFFATATPTARRIIDKLISPPFKLIGIMEGYFTHETHNEDAFLYWLPSIKQSRTTNVSEG